MTSNIQENEAEFDQFAEDYDAELNKGLSLTGESKEYFAEGRMRWILRRMRDLRVQVANALDFGCGTGSSTPYFFDILGAETLIGVDPSEDSLRVAREAYRDRATNFVTADQFTERASIDLAFCNGVFHHIPLDQRAEAAGFVFEALRPGAFFAFWENNAWNPATRFVMSRVPFDRDAILVYPHQARRLLRDAGFEVLGTDYQFIFPGSLARLRSLEPGLCKLPLGGQYLVLARKPGDRS